MPTETLRLNIESDGAVRGARRFEKAVMTASSSTSSWDSAVRRAGLSTRNLDRSLPSTTRSVTQYSGSLRAASSTTQALINSVRPASRATDDYARSLRAAQGRVDAMRRSQQGLATSTTASTAATTAATSAMAATATAATASAAATGRMATSVAAAGVSLGGLRQILGPLGVLLTFGGAVVGARRLFELGSEAEEARSKFVTTFGDATREVDEFLDSIAQIAGLDRATAEAATATVGNIVQGLGLGQQAAASFSQQVIATAADLTSFANVPIERTINAITTALTGEREALKTLGIVVRQAEVDQRAYAVGLREGIDGATDQAKALATLEIITERSGHAIGDLERTQESAANQARLFGAQIRDAATALGQFITPGVGGFLRGLNDNFDTLIVGAKALGAALTGLAGVGIARAIAGLRSLNISLAATRAFLVGPLGLPAVLGAGIGAALLFGNQAAQAATSIDDLAEATRRAGERIESVVPSIREAGFGAFNTAIDEARSRLVEIREEIERLNAIQAQPRIAAGIVRIDPATGDPTGAIQALQDEEERLTVGLRNANRELAGFRRTQSEAFDTADLERYVSRIEGFSLAQLEREARSVDAQIAATLQRIPATGDAAAENIARVLQDRRGAIDAIIADTVRSFEQLREEGLTIEAPTVELPELQVDITPNLDELRAGLARYEREGIAPLANSFRQQLTDAAQQAFGAIPGELHTRIVATPPTVAELRETIARYEQEASAAAARGLVAQQQGYERLAQNVRVQVAQAIGSAFLANQYIDRGLTSLAEGLRQRVSSAIGSAVSEPREIEVDLRIDMGSYDDAVRRISQQLQQEGAGLVPTAGPRDLTPPPTAGFELPTDFFISSGIQLATGLATGIQNEQIGSALGTAAGAGIGAALGSPQIGATIGGAIGTIIGGLFGDDTERNRLLAANNEALNRLALGMADTAQVIGGISGREFDLISAAIGDTARNASRSSRSFEHLERRLAGTGITLAQVVDFASTFGIELNNSRQTMQQFSQALRAAEAAAYQSIAGQLELANLAADLSDADPAQRAQSLIDIIGRELSGGLATMFRGQDFGAIVERIAAGQLDLSELGNVSLDTLLAAIRQIESLGDQAQGAARALGEASGVLNAPAGFKVSLARFNAIQTDAEEELSKFRPQATPIREIITRSVPPPVIVDPPRIEPPIVTPPIVDPPIVTPLPPPPTGGGGGGGGGNMPMVAAFDLNTLELQRLVETPLTVDTSALESFLTEVRGLGAFPPLEVDTGPLQAILGVPLSVEPLRLDAAAFDAAPFAALRAPMAPMPQPVPAAQPVAQRPEAERQEEQPRVVTVFESGAIVIQADGADAATLFDELERELASRRSAGGITAFDIPRERS